MTEIIGGINPILEALRARGEAFQRLYVAKGRSGPELEEIYRLARACGVRVQRVEREQLDRLYGRRGHQGVAAEVGPQKYYTLEDVLERAQGPRALVVVLDGVQDPMNLGSLLRTADAAGAAGLVVPRERAAPLTPTAVKASAGAAEYVPVARVVNVARTLEEMKDAGFWIIGTEAGAGRTIYEADLNLRLGLVLGGEGQGLRRLVREKCDLLVSIPQRGRINSLNVAVAGAVAMFEFVRQTGCETAGQALLP